jgi:hypothetical protein
MENFRYRSLPLAGSKLESVSLACDSQNYCFRSHTSSPVADFSRQKFDKNLIFLSLKNSKVLKPEVTNQLYNFSQENAKNFLKKNTWAASS